MRFHKYVLSALRLLFDLESEGLPGAQVRPMEMFGDAVQKESEVGYER